MTTEARAPQLPERQGRPPAGKQALLTRFIKRVIPVLVGVAALGALVVAVNPRSLAQALSRFNPVVIPVVLLLSFSWYVLQGLRWHFLLRDAGARLRIGDSLLLSIAGQTITALVPLGDLTRALFASQAGRVAFGSAGATVTVQELTFTLLLILVGIPGMLSLQIGAGAVGGVLLGMLAIFAILTVPPLFRVVHGAVSRLPLARRLGHQIEELQEETVELLTHPATLAWALVDLLRALVGVASFWLIVQGLAPGAVDWWEAAFVVAVAYVGGAISFLPGGTGASDLSVVGLLLLLGVDAGTAAAAALLQRVAVTGMATGPGFVAYLAARRRYGLTGLLSRSPQ